MCIVLLTTAHPDYALIVIDNRDEFILRPTSRPHWWTPGADATANTKGPAGAAPAQTVLSSRDLQRPEHGTWLGITRAGHFAVLTNFREDEPNDAAHPIAGQRSRGGMVTAWLAADPAESTEQFAARMLAGPGVKGVGGFSLICGKLRRHHFEPPPLPSGAHPPLAILSNRADELAQVPWIAGRRGEVYGLSNARYDEPEVWPKVRDGTEALRRVAEAGTAGPDALRGALFAILDRDTLPRRDDLSFEDHIPLLKQSIFIPAIGDAAHRAAMDKAQSAAAAAAAADNVETLVEEERPDEQQQQQQQPANGFMTGLYGTQRQTVILVDWQGHVSFTERALWDANGNAIPRGQGDVHFDFTIDGWDEPLVGPENGAGQ